MNLMKRTPTHSIDTASLPMREILALCGQDPPLQQRQAIHLMQTEAINPDHFAAASLRKRFYGFANLLQFEIGRILFVGFGVPPQSVKAIMRALHSGGFFLRPGQKAEIQRNSRNFERPAELREHLNAVYGLGLHERTSTDNLLEVEGKVRRVPRTERQLQVEIRQAVAMATRLAHKGPRPWPFYTLVFRKGAGWDFEVGKLPGQKCIESEDAVPRVVTDEASFKQFYDLVSTHPGSILLNLQEIERRLRLRFDERYGAPVAGDEDDENG